MKFQLSKFNSISSILKNFPAIPFEDKAQLPYESGVYIVTNLREKVIYIGKTNNFNTRWISHHKIKEIESSFNIKKILIAFCILPKEEIDQAEAVLINQFKPELNRTMVSSESIVWLSSNSAMAEAPSDLRQYAYQSSNCACVVCGKTIVEKESRLIKFVPNIDDLDNLAVACRSCSSRMRSCRSIEEFKVNQKKIMLRDLSKLGEIMSLCYESKNPLVDELSDYIAQNEILLAYEKN